MERARLCNAYSLGRRDFSGENLQGLSLRNCNFSHADFSASDIRGTDFTNAVLSDANFDSVVAGLQFYKRVLLFVGFVLVLSISGVALSNTGDLAANLGTREISKGIDAIPAIATHLVLGLYLGFIILKGFTPIVLSLVGGVAGTLAVLEIGAGLFLGEEYRQITFESAWVIAGTGSWVIVGTLLESIMMVAIISICDRFLGILASAIIIGAVIVIDFFYGSGASGGVAFIRWSLIVSVSFALLGYYSCWKALSNDANFNVIRAAGLVLSTFGGTSFRVANLTDSNFSRAIMKNTDLTESVLVRTNWHHTQKLNLARVGGTILINPEVRELLVTYRGDHKSYVGCNLQGVSLVEAELSNSDFTEADLSGAYLKRACLENSTLKKVQALNTNFYQAKLTGACLESWNIDNLTVLEGVACDYVYLLQNKKERRPNSGKFQPGEFSKLFQEVIDTIDLIFQNGIDWKSFLKTFHDIQVEHDGSEVAIQSIENKGDGVVVVKLNAALNSDKALIHESFMSGYHQALSVAENHYKERLHAEKKQIQDYRRQNADMQEVVKMLASRPITVEVKAIANSQSESKSMQGNDQSKNINIQGNVENAIVALGDISGQVSNQINELGSSKNQIQLKDLLTQLQTAIETEPALSEEIKAEALEEIRSLAKLGKSPQNEGTKKLARRAMNTLRGIISGITSATALVEVCNKLVPAIGTLFGV